VLSSVVRAMGLWWWAGMLWGGRQQEPARVTSPPNAHRHTRGARHSDGGAPRRSWECLRWPCTTPACVNEVWGAIKVSQTTHNPPSPEMALLCGAMVRALAVIARCLLQACVPVVDPGASWVWPRPTRPHHPTMDGCRFCFRQAPSLPVRLVQGPTSGVLSVLVQGEVLGNAAVGWPRCNRTDVRAELLVRLSARALCTADRSACSAHAGATPQAA
jgi:hypothetical protein